MDKFLALMRLIDTCIKGQGTSPVPVIAHCAGGIGRSGTLIAADCGARAVMLGADPCMCSPDKLVRHVRNSRMNMVSTADQYEFLHCALPRLVAQLSEAHCEKSQAP